MLWSRNPSPSSSHFTEFSINRLPIEPRQKRVTPVARKAHSRRSRALTPPVYDRRNFPCQKKQAFNGGLVWCVWPGLGAVRFKTGFPGNAIAPQGRPCSVGLPVTVFGWFSLSPSATLSGIGTVLHVQAEMELSNCDAFHSASVLTLVRSTQ